MAWSRCPVRACEEWGYCPGVPSLTRARCGRLVRAEHGGQQRHGRRPSRPGGGRVRHTHGGEVERSCLHGGDGVVVEYVQPSGARRGSARAGSSPRWMFPSPAPLTGPGAWPRVRGEPIAEPRRDPDGKQMGEGSFGLDTQGGTVLR